MADISMCPGVECPLRDNCYRYRAIPNKHRQSMFMYPPYKDGTCGNFWDINLKPKGYYNLAPLKE
jgi:hypothetical protein